MKISFVIPYFNGKKYIIECLDSIYSQAGIVHNEFEVIIVDDCSTDQESLESIRNYQQSKSNLRIVKNTQNSRCGESRNRGLREAKGDYIWFVDQDDYINPNCVSHLLTICQNESLDMLLFDYSIVNDDKSSNIPSKLIRSSTKTLTGLDYIQTYCEGDFWSKGYDTNVWHTIFKREFLIENNIFSPAVSYCEDMIVALHAIILAKRLLAIAETFYCYRNNANSVYHTEVGKKGRPIFDASLYAGEQMIELSELVNSDYLNLKKAIYSGGLFRLNTFCKSVLKISRRERTAFYSQVFNHKAIIDKINPYLRGWSRWLIVHPNLVLNFPKTIYILIKISEII